MSISVYDGTVVVHIQGFDGAGSVFHLSSAQLSPHVSEHESVGMVS